MNKLNILIGFVLLSVLIWSCTKENTSQEVDQLSYYKNLAEEFESELSVRSEENFDLDEMIKSIEGAINVKYTRVCNYSEESITVLDSFEIQNKLTFSSDEAKNIYATILHSLSQNYYALASAEYSLQPGDIYYDQETEQLKISYEIVKEVTVPRGPYSRHYLNESNNYYIWDNCSNSCSNCIPNANDQLKWKLNYNTRLTPNGIPSGTFVNVEQVDQDLEEIFTYNPPAGFFPNQAEPSPDCLSGAYMNTQLDLYEAVLRSHEDVISKDFKTVNSIQYDALTPNTGIDYFCFVTGIEYGDFVPSGGTGPAPLPIM